MTQEKAITISNLVMNRSQLSLKLLYNTLVDIHTYKAQLRDLYQIFFNKINLEIYEKQQKAKKQNIQIKNQIVQQKKHLQNKRIEFFGQTKQWQQYPGGGLFVDVDIKHLKLKQKPFISYFINGNNAHWELAANNIYNLTNQGFRIYVYRFTNCKNCTIQQAQKNDWTIHYQVIQRINYS